MANYVIEDNKCLVNLSDVETAKTIAVDQTKPLGQIFTTLGRGIFVYLVTNIAAAGIYPVTVTSGAAVVTMVAPVAGATGYFIFEYQGSLYVCHVANGTAGEWVNITPSKATETEEGVVKLTTNTDTPTSDQSGIALAGSMGFTLAQMIRHQRIPIHGMLMTSTSITQPSQVAGMLGYGTWSYYGQLVNSTSQIAVNVFIRLT